MALDRRRGGERRGETLEDEESVMRGKMLERVGEWKVIGRVWI